MSFLLAVVESSEEEFSTVGIEEAIGRLPSKRLTKLVACYFYALLVHRCVVEGWEPRENCHEILASLVEANPHDVILSGLNRASAGLSVERNSMKVICDNFKNHMADLIAVSQPPEVEENEVAGEAADVVDVIDSEVAASTSMEAVVDAMKESEEIFQASSYLLANQPHHRMMNTLSAGLGMLKALGEVKNKTELFS